MGSNSRYLKGVWIWVAAKNVDIQPTAVPLRSEYTMHIHKKHKKGVKVNLMYEEGTICK